PPRVVLPGDDVDVRDPAPELEDVGACAGRRRPRAAQVVDAEGDRLRHALGAALVEQPEEGRQLEERAEHAAVDGRQTRVADELVAERQHAVPAPVDLLGVDAEEARVRDRLEDALHDVFSPRASMKRENWLPAELAPSMKLPRQLANGSSGLRS